MSARSALSFLLVAAAALTAAAAPLDPRTAPKPNIVFILADDLGYGDLGCYGQRRIPTPRLDQLAREGMRFTQFYAGAPVCAPSRNVLMTGQHAGQIHIRGNAKLDLPATDTTVAQLLKQAGYTTGLIGKWGLGREGGEATPVKKGFDHFFGYIDQTHAHNSYPTFLLRNDSRVPLRNVVPDEGPYGQGVASQRIDYSHDLFANDALAFLERHQREPFFLYLAFTLPHANNEAGDRGMEVPDYGAFAGEDWPETEKGFAAAIERLDRDVGRVLDRLEKLGLAENTIVFFTSDNGPHREGGHDPEFFASRGPLRGIKRSLHEGGIRVPLLVRWPGRIPAGRVTDQIGYLGDFFATAAALAGSPAPSSLPSVDLLPTLLDRPEAQAQHEYLYWEFYEGASAQAVRFDRWKAIRSPLFTGPIALFDLTTDLGEQHDVAADHPELVARAAAFMQAAHVPSPLWQPPKPAVR